MSQTLVAIILSLLVGLVFYKMKNTTDPGIQNRLGAIFFMVVSQIFSTVTALESLLKERVLFIHVSPYESVKHSIEAKDFFLGEC
jgi:ATP-binding cassette subfamily G (WHITE) protein 2